MKNIFDLQRFAVDGQGNFYADASSSITRSGISSYTDQPTINTTTLTGLTPEMKEFYSKDLIETAGPNLIHAQLGSKVSMPKGSGNTIEWRKWGKFAKALTPLTEGVTPVASSIAVTPIRKTLDQFGDYTLVTDLLQLEAIDNTIVEITAKHSENAALTLDTIVRDEILGTLGIPEGNAGSVSHTYDMTGKLTVTEVAKAVTELKKKNAPKIDGSYVAVVHPAVAYDIMTSTDWIDIAKYADSTRIFEGEIGKLYGVRFVETTEAKVVKGAFGTGTAGGANKYTATYTAGSSEYTLTFPDNTLASGEIAADTKFCVTVGTSKVVVEADEASSGQVVKLKSAVTGATSTQTYTVQLAAAAKDGADYFPVLFFGKDAFKVVSIDSMEVIVKPNGSSGTSDPLNQRASVGWVIPAYGAAVTQADYIYKLNVCSSITAEAN